MLKNYFTILIRNLKRSLGYTCINILGLSLGLATCILIFLWVKDEVSYDKFHKDKDRLYKVMSNSTYSNGSIDTGEATTASLSDAIINEIPEVESALRIAWSPDEFLIVYEDISFMEKGRFADENIFEMFSFPIVSGDAKNPLPNEHSIAISRKLSEKFFREENPVGKIFKIDNQYDLVITAIFENIPVNSSLQFDYIIPFNVHLKKNEWMKGWGNSSLQTFVKLREGTSLADVNAKISGLVKKNCDYCFSEPFLFSFQDYRLHSNFKDGKNIGGRIEYINIFIIVALFILIIACINFMNMATARSSLRAKEVGVRKVIGAQRKDLIFQFLGESIILSFISLLLSILFVELAFPFFNEVTGKSVEIDYTAPINALTLIAISLVTGLLAGIYPAFFLSSFIPITVLKGKLTANVSGASFRKILVVFQFSLSIILIISSLVIYNQLDYIKNKNLGLNKENVISFNLRGDWSEKTESFKSLALQHSTIKSISFSGNSPFEVHSNTTDPEWPGKPENEIISFHLIMSDEDFIETMGMEIVEGRSFKSGNKSDSINYILNEAAVKRMGLTESVGTPLKVWGGQGEIIGVVKDFHNRNLREEIKPLIFMYAPENSWRGFVRLDGKDIQASLAHLGMVHKEINPSYPFDYQFLDEEYNNLYISETTMGKLSFYFTIMAILISCLGLFGLAAFTAEQRTKEIGVRKILGASIESIVLLLSKDFLKPVLISILIATPIAWYAADQWLQEFRYREEINITLFVIAGGLSILIAWLTVCYQSLRAAITNPVDSLRGE
ncbi:MAG: ABC transporter permease [Bacteroidota bacterium]|nr:ABC transporter permease [Bacteroidota bacterium]